MTDKQEAAIREAAILAERALFDARRAAYVEQVLQAEQAVRIASAADRLIIARMDQVVQRTEPRP